MEKLTYEKVRQLFNYDPNTGQLMWKKQDDRPKSWNSRYGGKAAGTYTNTGYSQIRISGNFYLAHRLIWLWNYGCWPEEQIDHIDGCGYNNCLNNLRLSTQSQNRMNSRISRSNSSGITGVWFNSSLGKYCAQIKVKYKTIWLGSFYSLELATKIRKEAEEKYFGEFAYKDKVSYSIRGQYNNDKEATANKGVK